VGSSKKQENMLLEDLLGLTAEELEWYQMALRALLVFFVSLIFIRVAGMRSFGNRSAFDVVLNITIGAVLARAIAGHYPFFTCLLTAAVLALCHRGTALLTSRYELFRKLIEGDPIRLFHGGKKDQSMMKRHSISIEDVNRTLREENLDDLTKVKEIWFETDGKISIVKKPNDQ
jgi:uncharacterized membrane protein YcaP (DUF421 family)